ncbi:hypothetical protein WJX73_010102 [Symbiochloris irregularis]|uniref:Protein kinase A anchor protein nuclear localisation signal domain-containing protein n=1 Tax=Symbiochloris irregularis TaxID=706552 RepID=A0AAW1P887_9CHLO
MASESDELCRTYEGMQATFAKQGLDLEFIAGLRDSYQLDEHGEPQPLTYAELRPSLPPATQRLVVFPLDTSAELLKQAVAATEDIIDHALPPGTTVYTNAPSRLHITIFYLSHVEDPQPEPYKAKGSGATHSSDLNPERLQLEEETLRSAVAQFPAFSVQVDRVLLANSGTLLLTYTDPSGQMQAFRSHLRKTLPGAPKRQTNIIHTSLLRILSPQQLDDKTREAVQAKCDEWTQKLRGKELPCSALWYLHESYYANIQGKSTTLSLK